MATRTLPSSFPLLRRHEAAAGRIFRASLARRLAQAQNYLWANLRKVYAAHASEGLGNIMQNIPASVGADQLFLEQLPDGSSARPMASFFVPRNWCGGTNLKLNIRTVMARTVVGTTCKVIAALYDLDDLPTGIWTSVSPTVGTVDNVLSLRVPQDAEYQCRVFLQFTNGDPTFDTYLANYAYISNVSARYDLPDEQDLDGVSFNTVGRNWLPHVDIPDNEWWPCASHIIKRILDNTLNLYYTRGPELCQSYLAANYNPTTSFAEVGRYVVWQPRGVTEWQGRLVAYVDSAGGAGCEVRLKVDGTVVQTWTALAAGVTVLTLSAVALSTPTLFGQERTVTVEAKNLGGTTYWGTTVWGVQVWETAVDETSIGGLIPTAFAPLDEAGLEGKDYITANDNGAGERCGFTTLQQNDRYLYKNRLRQVIGDWRHYTYKRLSTFASATSTYDPRVDWTRGDPSTRQLLAPRNITINGTSSGVDEQDALGDFAYGAGSSVGYSEAPYTYPTSMTHARHGRRLGLYYWGHVFDPVAAGVYSAWVLRCRGRRLRPALMSTDQNGFGPIPEETPYINKAYFQPTHNGSVQSNIPITGSSTKPDHERRWHLAMRASHAVSIGTPSNSIRGRIPPQASGAPPALRPEGMLFEVELNSVYWADEPLTQEALDALA